MATYHQNAAYFIHKPVGFIADEYVHPEHTPKLWAALWQAAKNQTWWEEDEITYVGNQNGWYYFQKWGVTSGFARCRLEIPVTDGR